MIPTRPIYILDILYGDQTIGQLSYDHETDELAIQYEDSWLTHGFAISPHLPLITPLPSLNIRRYLENLLPENKGLDYLTEYLSVPRRDIHVLIEEIGRDVSGGFMFAAEGQCQQILETGFEPIEVQDLIYRLSDPHLKQLEVWGGRPRLSVAGVQPKLNVLVLDNKYGFGKGELCSTHILKFEKSDQTNLILNEFITMRLAQSIGLDVADVEFVYFGQHPALLVKRFDRELISGPRVRRKHVIDACQASNLGVGYKYERNFGNQRDVKHIRDGVSIDTLLSIAELCECALTAKNKILDWVLFNLCVFNSDAHGKNISFYVGDSGLVVAPYYDLVNIRMYPQYDQDLSMAIGDEFDSDTINAYQLAELGYQFGVEPSAMQKRLSSMIDTILSKIDGVIASFEAPTHEQLGYLDAYRRIVVARCTHFLNELVIINDIEL